MSVMTDVAVVAVLEEAARYVATPPPSAPFSAAVCAAMVPTLLEQRGRLSRALMAAYPAFVAPRHQRARGGGVA